MPPLLILASTSPRRRELLAILGVPFEVIPPTSQEELRPDRTTREQVRKFALDKAQSVAPHHPHTLVLGSDTLIELDDKPVGKPRDLREAEKMLNQLLGRQHLVHTAVALVREKPQTRESLVETVSVWMRQLGEQEVAEYLKTEESLGKAGAYSIQGEGARLIERIEGDYPTIVGLPLWHTAKLLEQHGVVLPNPVEEIYRLKLYNNWKNFS